MSTSNRRERRAQKAVARTKESRDKSQKELVSRMKVRLPLLVESAHRFFDREQARALKESGLEPSCGKGCASCCDQLTLVTIGEAVTILQKYPKVVKKALPVLQQLASKVDEIFQGQPAFNPASAEGREVLEAASDMWWAGRNTCAFLDAETKTCQIYDSRPLTCRTYLVTSDPARCALREDEAEAQGTDTMASVINFADLRGSTFEMLLRSESEYLKRMTLGPLPNVILSAIKNTKGT